MKRLIGRGLLFVGVFAGIANYLIYLQTGQMPARDWWIKIQSGSWHGSIQQLEASAAAKIPGAKTKVEVYKWTDADGVVHYGEKPGTEAAEVISVQTQGNSMAAPVSVPVGEAQEQVNQPQGSPLEQARAAAEAMRAHNQAQDAIQ